MPKFKAANLTGESLGRLVTTTFETATRVSLKHGFDAPFAQLAAVKLTLHALELLKSTIDEEAKSTQDYAAQLERLDRLTRSKPATKKRVTKKAPAKAK